MAYASYQKKDYLQSDKVSRAESELTDYKGQKPGDYSSKYQQQIEDLYGKINNRPKFNYNVNEDALYKSMAQRYRQQGKQAMLDAMGQAATMTGGYGNSYAQSVGQQTYQGYLQSLADLVPDYYKMALDAYNAEGDDLYKRYSMALDQEDTDYSRWQDKNNAYLQELNRLQGVYESERNFDYNKWAADQDFDYNSFINDRDLQYKQDRDTVADDQWMKEWERQQERDRVSVGTAVQREPETVGRADGIPAGAAGRPGGGKSGAVGQKFQHKLLCGRCDERVPSAAKQWRTSRRKRRNRCLSKCSCVCRYFEQGAGG